MPNICVNVTNKRAIPEGGKTIICGNSDYALTFTFDNEWTGYDNKTARFAYWKNGEALHIDQVFSGDTVKVPVLSGINFVMVGVFAGDLQTTTPAKIPCETSILCYEGAPENPPEDVYNQIIHLLNALEVGTVSDERVAEAVENYMAENPVTTGTTAIYESTTYAEVVAAYESGKDVICFVEKYGLEWTARLICIDDSYCYFSAEQDGTAIRVRLSTSDVWDCVLASLQKTSGRVTSLSVESTDTQYPSAKCVYDALADKADRAALYGTDTVTGEGNNIFDSDNMDSVMLNCSSTTFTAASTLTGVIIPIDNSNGTTITVEKELSTNRFQLVTSAEYPSAGVTAIQNSGPKGGITSYTLTGISDEEKWLYIILHYSAADTYTLEEIVAGLKVYYGDIYILGNTTVHTDGDIDRLKNAAMPTTDRVNVFLGDSIIAFDKTYSGTGAIPDYIADRIGGTWHNYALGGTSLAAHTSQADTYGHFSLIELADSIASGDWTAQETGVTNGAVEINTSYAIADMVADMSATDWSAVSNLCVNFGANDLAYSHTVGSSVDEASNSGSVCAALKYAVNQIQTVYPGINIIVCGITYRAGDTVSIDRIIAANDAIADTCKRIGIQHINMQQLMGVNENNYSRYLRDTVHPSASGKQRYADVFCSQAAI